jgi:hypothetical protein
MGKKDTTPAAAPSPVPAVASGDSVVVALNHPHGIVFALAGGRKAAIAGNASGLRGREKGTLPVGAYGLTVLPAGDWQYIQDHYGKMEIFQSGLIFAQSGSAGAEAQARERAELRHGREPADAAGMATQEARAEDR